MSRKKRILRLFISWVLLIGCSSELLVRIWVHHIYQSPLPTGVVTPFEESPLLPDGLRSDVLYLAPNFSAVAESTGITYTTNAWGFRDDPVNPDKQHVIFLGDSTTFGLNIPHEATYAEVWEQLAGEGWQAINTAVPGRGTINEYEVLQSVLAKEIQPVGVVVGFFANDVKNDVAYGKPPEWSWLDQFYTWRIAHTLIDHAQIQQDAQPRWGQAIQVGQADLLWNRSDWQTSLYYLSRIHDLAAEYGAQAYVLYIPAGEYEVWNGSSVAQVLKRYTTQENIPFVDGVEIYQTYMNTHKLTAIPAGFYSIPGDMGHPGILASKLLGQAIYAATKPG